MLRGLGIVAAVSLVVRLGFFFWGLSGWYTDAPNTLSRMYLERGYGIAAGYGYVDAPELAGLKRRIDSGEIVATGEIAQREPLAQVIPNFIHPPGMSLLVAGLHRLFRMPVDIPLQGVMILLDITAACVIYALATASLGQRVGTATGFLYALYPPFAYASTFFLSPEGMLAPFVLGCASALWMSTRREGDTALAWGAVGGILLGTGSYLRPDYLALPVAMSLALVWYTGRWRKSLLTAVVCQGFALLVLLPWAYRNHQLAGRWIFTSTGVGPVLITGLGEFDNPWGIGTTDEHRAATAREQGFRSWVAPEADAYFRDLFWKSVADKPMGLVLAIAKRIPLGILSPHGWGHANPAKTEHFVDAAARGEDRYAAIRKRPAYVLRAYWDYLLIAGINLLAVAGCVFMLLHHPDRGLILLLLMPHAYSVGSHLLTHMEPRFLLPSTACLLLGLAYSLVRLRDGLLHPGSRRSSAPRP